VGFRADLHVHIGATCDGRPVKIGASKFMTLESVVAAARSNGIEVLGVVDFVRGIFDEAMQHLASGVCVEHADGGLWYDGVIVVPGFEVEIRRQGRNPVHFVCLFADFGKAYDMGRWLWSKQKNPSISCQRTYCEPAELLDVCLANEGVFWPAHAFTPHRGFYGTWERYQQAFSKGSFHAIELGLSADSASASYVHDTEGAHYVSASDAHSCGSIGREHMHIAGTASFGRIHRWLTAANTYSNIVIANHGLDPRLGKYYRSACPKCKWVARGVTQRANSCHSCGHPQLIQGVFDRIKQIGSEHPLLRPRPPYVYEVPLRFVPGVTLSGLRRLAASCGSNQHELAVCSPELLTEVLGEGVAEYVYAAREGRLMVLEGGGGQCGRVLGIMRA